MRVEQIYLRAEGSRWLRRLGERIKAMLSSSGVRLVSREGRFWRAHVEVARCSVLPRSPLSHMPVAAVADVDRPISCRPCLACLPNTRRRGLFSLRSP